MNGFVERSVAGAVCLVSPALEARGIRHGFIGKPFNFAKDWRVESGRLLVTALGASGIAILNQVHGDSVAELPEKLSSDPIAEADGTIFPLITPGRSVIVGVRTADCVPLLLVGKRWGAVVHAGWRGLAKDIIGKAASKLQLRDPSTEITALIGPCAGKDRYEVGSEVITAVGTPAVASAASNEKFLFDLAATATQELNARGITEIVVAEICTISNERFHSFRRDKEKTGNNLGFLVTRPA